MAAIGSESDGDEKNAVLTVRIIRSFEHRNIRPVVFRDVDLDGETATSFLRRVLLDLETRPGLTPPVRKYDYDAMKVTHKAHGAKTNNLVINVEDDDERLLDTSGSADQERSLRQSGVEHETELSLFKMDDYRRYKQSLDDQETS